MTTDSNSPERYGASRENIVDGLLARGRENEPRESLENVREILIANDKLNE